MAIAIQYDPLSPQMLADPYPLYAQLREKQPIFWHEKMQSWVVTHYRDCREVLRNNELFARDRRRVGQAVPEFQQSVQTLDPPTQKPLRGLFVNTLRNQDTEAIGQRARQHVTRILERNQGKASFDWMREVAAPVSLRITADLMGVVEPELAPYVGVSEALAYRMDAGLDASVITPGDAARKKFNALVDSWFDTQDYPGALRKIRDEADRAKVPEHYVRNTTAVTFNASFGTLYATAGNVALTLLQHPEVLGKLQDGSLVAPGVHELIRFDGPAQGTSRFAMTQTVIQGQVIEAGQTVLTLTAAANRDPAQFETPDAIVLDRRPNQHLGFGWGPHACLGQLFGEIAVSALVRGLVDASRPLRLAGEPVRRRTATVRSLSYLPVTFE
ncbi:cytochrome P450 [Streptomyces sp. NPDC005865]|uniref:cytochrome P450 n=1 Tax=Streptomyces sp. NPDC005865 TaxID=3155453 RepID=UPI003404D42E